MKKCMIFLISIFIFLFNACTIFVSANSNGRKTGGSQLKAISVFHEYNSYREKGKEAPVFCFFGNSVFETENDTLPQELNIRNGSKKVYRVNSRSGGQIMFPFHGWAAFSLEQYYENGCIEFDIAGSAGGEDLTIGLRSDTRGIVRTHTISLSSQQIEITKSFSHVKIPIKTIAASSSDGFDIKSIVLVTLNVSKAQLIYLSEMYISSPDFEIQHPVIKVNQAGYRTGRQKYALVSCFPGTFDLSEKTKFSVKDRNNRIRFSGNLQLVRNRADDISGEIIFRADFSSFDEEGEFCISITNPEIGNSFFFGIGTDVYDDLFVDAMRYFYFQRQGFDLEYEHAGIFSRKNLHPGDSRIQKLSQGAENDPVFDLSQGWYDAGDFGKYFPPAASTVSDLLFAWEFFPFLFSDGQLNIPESGNGTPDILDEIKWELDMMLKFEDRNTGAFWEVANYMNVGENQEKNFIIDTSGEGGRGNTISTAATAAAAGIFSHAYTVYKNFPQYGSFAKRCLDAAQRAWNYLEANPGNSWVSGAGRTYYHDIAEINIYKFWAAAALYRASGNSKYRAYVLNEYKNFDYNRQFNAYQVFSLFPLGIGFLHYAMTENHDNDFMNFLEEKFLGFEKVQLNHYREKVWPSMPPDWAYFWGSNLPICRAPVELFLFNKILGKDTSVSIQAVQDALHYLLGINPLSFSFVSGYGERSVKNIFSGIYSYDGIDEIPPGYMAGGSNGYDSGFMSNWPSKCYVDSDREWTTNEHAIYWNASLVLLLAAERGTSEN